MNVMGGKKKNPTKTAVSRQSCLLTMQVKKSVSSSRRSMGAMAVAWEQGERRR